jgi:hypothetical protein
MDYQEIIVLAAGFISPIAAVAMALKFASRRQKK